MAENYGEDDSFLMTQQYTPLNVNDVLSQNNSHGSQKLETIVCASNKMKSISQVAQVTVAKPSQSKKAELRKITRGVFSIADATISHGEFVSGQSTIDVTEALQSSLLQNHPPLNPSNNPKSPIITTNPSSESFGHARFLLAMERQTHIDSRVSRISLPFDNLFEQDKASDQNVDNIINVLPQSSEESLNPPLQADYLSAILKVQQEIAEEHRVQSSATAVQPTHQNVVLPHPSLPLPPILSPKQLKKEQNIEHQRQIMLAAQATKAKRALEIQKRLAREQQQRLDMKATKAVKAAQEAKNAQKVSTAEEVRFAKAIQDAKAAQAAKEAKGAKVAQQLKAAKEAQKARDARAVQEARASQATIDAKAAQALKEAKAAQAAKEAKAAQTAKEAKAAQAAKEAKAAQALKEAKDAQAAKEAKDAQAAKEAKDTQAAQAALETQVSSFQRSSVTTGKLVELLLQAEKQINHPFQPPNNNADNSVKHHPTATTTTTTTDVLDKNVDSIALNLDTTIYQDVPDDNDLSCGGDQVMDPDETQNFLDCSLLLEAKMQQFSQKQSDAEGQFLHHQAMLRKKLIAGQKADLEKFLCAQKEELDKLLLLQTEEFALFRSAQVEILHKYKNPSDIGKDEISTAHRRAKIFQESQDYINAYYSSHPSADLIPATTALSPQEISSQNKLTNAIGYVGKYLKRGSWITSFFVNNIED